MYWLYYTCGVLGIAPDVSRPGEVPVCKDFLKGECRRGGKCRFRHLSIREYEMELTYGARNPSHTSSAVNGLASISRRRERFDFEDGRWLIFFLVDML
jgi:hypothetical protein